MCTTRYRETRVSGFGGFWGCSNFSGICHTNKAFHTPPKDGEIALWSATKRWYVVKCVSQKRNQSNNKAEWCNILVNFKYVNSTGVNTRLKYVYSVNSVNMDLLPGNTENRESTRSWLIRVRFLHSWAVSMGRVTYFKESCHVCVGVVWLRHVTYTHEVCHTYQWVVSMCYITYQCAHINGSHQWVMSHIWMRHVNEQLQRNLSYKWSILHMNESRDIDQHDMSCHTCEGVISRATRDMHVASCHVMSQSHVTYINEGFYTYQWVVWHILTCHVKVVNVSCHVWPEIWIACYAFELVTCINKEFHMYQWVM